MRFSADALRAVLEECLPPGTRGLAVAVSGGSDSACLLAALVADGAPARCAVRAVHVDHGLQHEAAALRESCSTLCARLGVALEVLVVHVDVRPGRSVEAEARLARYRAIAGALEPGEVLLTAHHAQDQAETLLLQLLRGAGLKGLAAMPVRRALGRGWHVRPLLGISREALLEFGSTRDIAGVEDPMNEDLRFDRVYLRRKLWPALEQRWPGAATALSRSAQHLAQAQALLDASASRAVDRLRDGDALSVPGLRALASRERVNILRHWLAAASIVPPSTARLAEALRQIFTARPDQLPVVVFGEYALRRYQDRLFVTPATLPALPDADIGWRVAPDARLDLGPGLGVLCWQPQLGGLDVARLPAIVCVRRRRGGETLKSGARARTHSVQHLCQAQGVLPWMRDALPMIHSGDVLLAVGDLWHDARFAVAADAPGLGLRWLEAPVLM